MKNRNRGCSSGCRLDPERPESEAAIRAFHRKHPERRPEACGLRKIEPAKETK